MGTYRTTRRALAGLVALAALALPAHASAAAAGIAAGKLYVSSGDESANLSITRVGGNLVVSDPTQSLNAGWFCSASGYPAKITCPAAYVTEVSAALGEGDDRFDGSGLAVPTVVDGGSGTDVFLTRNGVVDEITCGAGADSGQVDAADSLTPDCETAVERPAPLATDPPLSPVVDPPQPPGPQAVDTPVVPDPPADGDEEEAPDVTVADAPVKITTPAAMTLSAKGDITVGVSCTADSGSCKGTIELIESDGQLKTRSVVGTARRRKAPKKKAIVLARRNFSVRAGHKKKVQLRLDRNGRQRIIKKKKKKTKAKLVISMTAPDGTETTTTKNVTISPPKERRTSNRGRKTGKKKTSR